MDTTSLSIILTNPENIEAFVPTAVSIRQDRYYFEAVADFEHYHYFGSVDFEQLDYFGDCFAVVDFDQSGVTVRKRHKACRSGIRMSD